MKIFSHRFSRRASRPFFLPAYEKHGEGMEKNEVTNEGGLNVAEGKQWNESLKVKARTRVRGTSKANMERAREVANGNRGARNSLPVGVSLY